MKRINEQDKNKFFNKLAIKMNISDINLARRCYYSLVEMLREDLMNGGDTDWPELGKWKLIKHKGRNSYDIEAKALMRIADVMMMKFYPCEAMKCFWKQFGLSGENEGGDIDNEH